MFLFWSILFLISLFILYCVYKYINKKIVRNQYNEVKKKLENNFNNLKKDIKKNKKTVEKKIEKDKSLLKTINKISKKIKE